jgi:hypothetical protein
MKAREEMPLLRCALGPTGRPCGDGLHYSVTASGTDGRKAVITRNWDMAGSTLKKPIRGRKMGVGALALVLFACVGVDSRLLRLADALGLMLCFLDSVVFSLSLPSPAGRGCFGGCRPVGACAFLSLESRG